MLDRRGDVLAVGHLISHHGVSSIPEAAKTLTEAHDYLVERTRASLHQLTGERPAWGAFAKRATVDFDGVSYPWLGKPKERVIEAINMVATLERLLDALQWFGAQPATRNWLVLECHPSTSSTAKGNDLVLGPAVGDSKVLCEVTDVASVSAGQNGKEEGDLKRLGCLTCVPTDGQRRFICTSVEFGGALSAKARKWGNLHYRYRVHRQGDTMLLELEPA